MRCTQVVITGSLSAEDLRDLEKVSPQILLAFGDTCYFAKPEVLNTLHTRFPNALLIGCSTAGEVSQQGVESNTLVVSGIHFQHSTFQTAHTRLSDMADSFAAGARIGRDLAMSGLHSILIFAPGIKINGSALIRGIQSEVGEGVNISGGLAADAGRFQETFVVHGSEVGNDLIAAIGFHSPRTRLTHGTFSGWQPFGPIRLANRVENNVLYELDGEPALVLYKRYLGKHAEALPGSALLFPFALVDRDLQQTGVIRTILGMDEAQGSLILAGEVAPGSYLRLMTANSDNLIDGAEAAARAVSQANAANESLALLVSCVGRKMVMHGRVDEEVEAVGSVFGASCMLAGFYSNGEISPHLAGADCRLHNQTMTITLLEEVDA